MLKSLSAKIGFVREADFAFDKPTFPIGVEALSPPEVSVRIPDADPKGDAETEDESEATKEPLPKMSPVAPSSRVDRRAKHKYGSECKTTRYSKNPAHNRGSTCFPLN
jgi:hypothetical protein